LPDVVGALAVVVVVVGVTGTAVVFFVGAGAFVDAGFLVDAGLLPDAGGFVGVGADVFPAASSACLRSAIVWRRSASPRERVARPAAPPLTATGTGSRNCARPR
jgi:hypothetical protein